jgi:hypothetical protein
MLISMMLVGCETAAEPPVYDTRLNFLTNNGVSIYRVVYPTENCPDTVRSAAEELQAVMQEVLGVDVAITDDKGTANATDQFQPYEILIGRTARAATQKVLPELDGEEFIVRVDGHKIVIVGATNRATYAGVRHFIENVIRQGTVEDGKPVVKIETDYEYLGKYTSPKQPSVAGNTTLPVAPYRPAVLYTVDQPDKKADQITLATLQGLSTLYSSEQVFILRKGNEAQLTSLVEQGAIAINHNDAEQTWTLGRLLNYYSNRLSGYILCSMDTTSESTEVAINLAHYLNAVVVTPENEEVAQAAGLSLVLDVTDKDDAWLRTTPYFGRMSKMLAVEPDIEQSIAFVDYVVMSGCYYHDYRDGDEYMHVQSFKHLDKGAYLLSLPTDDIHQTLTFDAIGVVVLTPGEALWTNLSVLMSADASGIEQQLTAKD